jgi:hypothetical protein
MAIIGISGYSGSGKDTVGRIIQYLHCDFQEDVAVEVAIHPDNDWLLEEQSGWEIKKWAGKLKQVASLLTGIPIHKFEDQEFKKTYLGPEWNYWTVSAIDNGKLKFQEGRFVTKAEAEGYAGFMEQTYGTFRMEYVVGMQQMTVRQFLQELGTDACRKGLHTNTWVNALMADYKRHPEHFNDVANGRETGDGYPNWIITDTRFSNEADAIKKAGGILIRVDRPGIAPVNAHPSETGLDNYQFDEYITNDGDLKKLTETVKEILIRREYYES